ncbi:MAG: aspartyl/asparaginyl beta-hydroxylase domain-containing protein [Cyanobacteria bacterium P01_F01_bin.150]
MPDKEPITIIRDLPPGFSKTLAQEISQATSLQWLNQVFKIYTNPPPSMIPLFNKSGDASQILIEECNAVPTSEMKKLPIMHSFLNRSGLSLLLVRLIKLAPGARVIEHLDYCDLYGPEKVRLHIPIVTTPDCRAFFQGRAVHLSPDAIWMFRPNTSVHAYLNGSITRLHLIIDAYVDDELRHEIENGYLPQKNVELLPKASSITYEKLLNTAEYLVTENQHELAEELLLRTIFKYDQPSGFTLDLIIRLYKKCGVPEKIEEWKARKAQLLRQPKVNALQRY